MTLPSLHQLSIGTLASSHRELHELLANLEVADIEGPLKRPGGARGSLMDDDQVVPDVSKRNRPEYRGRPLARIKLANPMHPMWRALLYKEIDASNMVNMGLTVSGREDTFQKFKAYVLVLLARLAEVDEEQIDLGNRAVGVKNFKNASIFFVTHTQTSSAGIAGDATFYGDGFYQRPRPKEKDKQADYDRQAVFFYWVGNKRFSGKASYAGKTATNEDAYEHLVTRKDKYDPGVGHLFFRSKDGVPYVYFGPMKLYQNRFSVVRKPNGDEETRAVFMLTMVSNKEFDVYKRRYNLPLLDNTDKFPAKNSLDIVSTTTTAGTSTTAADDFVHDIELVV